MTRRTRLLGVALGPWWEWVLGGGLGGSEGVFMPSKVPTWKPPALGSQPADRHREYNRFGRDKTLLDLYGTSRWKNFRKHVRTARILCERCSTTERPVIGVEVHHLVSPRERMDLAFDETNVELLCSSCHSRETATNTARRTQ